MTRDAMIEKLAQRVAGWHRGERSGHTSTAALIDDLLAALRSRPAPPDDLERKHRVPDDVMMLARAGKLIDAIKLLRHDFGLPLKEAKLLVEDAMRIEAIRATAAALAAPAPVAAPDDREDPQLGGHQCINVALDAANFCALRGDPLHAVGIRILVERYQKLAWAAPAPVAAPAHVSVSQGAALAAALDALESDATTDQRREAWDRLRDEFYPVAALAPETPAPTEPTR